MDLLRQLSVSTMLVALFTTLPSDGSAPPRPVARGAPLRITGLVTSAESTPRPLQYVRVQVEGTEAGAVTAADGRFAFDAPDSLRGRAVTLVARIVGYRVEKVPLRLDRDSVEAVIRMTAMPMHLSEVIVTGYAGGSPAAQVVASIDGSFGRGRVPSAAGNTEEFASLADNSFISPRTQPASTFGVDVDRASYAIVRSRLLAGGLPPAGAVRVEEMVNYFPYAYPAPTGAHPIAVHAEVTAAPWQPSHQLVRLAVVAKRPAYATLPPSNLTFLIDVSGSMSPDNRLPMVRDALLDLVDRLRPQDRVAIVVYAGAAGLVLPSTPGTEKEAIRAALRALSAGGSTAGGAGIRLAYQVAKAHFITGGNNRVILATDGDFNVGTSSTSELEALVTREREGGVALSVLGVGEGNLKDARMEKLADVGNGNYSYLDTPREARKVLGDELTGTLFTIAKDVKLQVEFNPARVAGWRLIGYENRVLRSEDFADDAKDAGDMGIGHVVTAFYEVIPPGAPDAGTVREAPAMRYSRPPRPAQAALSRELLQVAVRYKPVGCDTSVAFRQVVHDRVVPIEGETRFAAAVAAFAMLLRNSAHKGSATPELVRSLASQAIGDDVGGYRREFLQLVDGYERALVASAARKP
jgi:Ca-activated chloride channel family protein